MSVASNADRLISQQVTQKLANRGLRNPCRVAVLTKNGEVTLSGSVQFAHQKVTAASVTTGVSGVRRVNNQLIIKAQVKG